MLWCDEGKKKSAAAAGQNARRMQNDKRGSKNQLRVAVADCQQLLD
jgi:hypothetical protein